jgi:hypothetical protein
MMMMMMMMMMMACVYMMADVDGNGAVIIVSQEFDFLYMVSQENEFPYQIFKQIRIQIHSFFVSAICN